MEELVARVNDLNACANARGKGRSDMTVEVLEAAAKVFLQAGRLSWLQSIHVNPRQSIQKSRNRGLAMFSSFFKCFFGTGIWNVLDPSDFRAKRLGYLSREATVSVYHRFLCFRYLRSFLILTTKVHRKGKKHQETSVLSRKRGGLYFNPCCVGPRCLSSQCFGGLLSERFF